MVLALLCRVMPNVAALEKTWQSLRVFQTWLRRPLTLDGITEPNQRTPLKILGTSALALIRKHAMYLLRSLR